MPGVNANLLNRVAEGTASVIEGSKRTYLPGGVTLDAASAYDGSNTGYETTIRAGWLLAKETASSKYVPVKRTRAVSAGTSATTLIVTNAAAFKAGDAVTVAATSATTVASVDYSTHTITLAVAKTWSDDAVVIGGNAGAETAVCVLGEDVSLWDDDTMTNYDATAGAVYIAGLLNVSMVRGDLAAVRAISGNLITKNFNVFPTDV